MRYGHLLLAIFLAGCTSGNMPALEPEPAPGVPTASCEGKSAQQCRFINSPVKLSSKPLRLPDEPYPFYKTRNTLEFVDANGEEWIAPAGILTDGASIPPLFVPFIGDPRSKKFMNAATVHDSYCARSNRNNPYYHAAPWQDVHRMFYDALLVSGTSPIKAKIMYAAVYLGGPRWKGVRTPPKRKAALVPGMAPEAVTPAGGRGLRALQADRPLPELFSKESLIAAFRKAKAHIEAGNPPIAEVEIYLTRLEQDLSGGRQRPKPGRNFKAGPPQRGFDGLGGLGDGNSGGSNSGGSNSGGNGSDSPGGNDSSLQ